MQPEFRPKVMVFILKMQQRSVRTFLDLGCKISGVFFFFFVLCVVFFHCVIFFTIVCFFNRFHLTLIKSLMFTRNKIFSFFFLPRILGAILRI